MVEEPLLPNDTTFPRKKPLPVGKGSIHRDIGGESGDEMDMIGHNECKTRIPFAICSAELNGVKNDRRRGFVGKRTATPCIGWGNAVVSAVYTNSYEIFRMCSILGNANRWHMVKSPPNGQGV